MKGISAEMIMVVVAGVYMLGVAIVAIHRYEFTSTPVSNRWVIRTVAMSIGWPLIISLWLVRNIGKIMAALFEIVADGYEESD